MNRQERMNFIRNKNSFYYGVGFVGHTDELLRYIAINMHHEVNVGAQEIISGAISTADKMLHDIK